MRQGGPPRRKGTWLNLRVLSSESSPIRLEINTISSDGLFPTQGGWSLGLSLGFGSVSNQVSYLLIKSIGTV